MDNNNLDALKRSIDSAKIRVKTSIKQAKISTPRAQYLKLGDKVYSVALIKKDAFDVEKEILHDYNTKLKTIERDVMRSFDSMASIDNTEQERLIKARVVTSKHVFSYIDAIRLVMMKSSRAYNIVRSQYEPTVFSGNFKYMMAIVSKYVDELNVGRDENHKISGSTLTAYLEEIRKAGSVTGNVIVKTKKVFSVPIDVCFCDVDKTIGSHNVFTYHSMSWMKFCTGNNKYENVKDLSTEQLYVYLNNINVDSLGSRFCEFTDYIDGGKVGKRIYLREILGVRENIISIEPEGSSTWKTKR